MSCKPFFLNIILLNKDEVVANKITPTTGTGLLGQTASWSLNQLITDESILSQIAESLINGIQRTVSEMGIEAEFAVQFQQGPLVVIKVQVVEIDTLSLLLAAKGPEFASQFSTVYTAATLLGVGKAVHEKVNEKISGSINEGMMTKFAEMIPQKMSTNGIFVKCTPATSEAEAEVFFALLQRLQERGK